MLLLPLVSGGPASAGELLCPSGPHIAPARRGRSTHLRSPCGGASARGGRTRRPARRFVYDPCRAEGSFSERSAGKAAAGRKNTPEGTAQGGKANRQVESACKRCGAGER